MKLPLSFHLLFANGSELQEKKIGNLFRGINIKGTPIEAENAAKAFFCLLSKKQKNASHWFFFNTRNYLGFIMIRIKLVNYL
jgi:hypothetical protein